MKAFKINCWTRWKHLPWNQIKERMFVLKIQIYEASKSCNYRLTYKAQNILVNSNEAKILAIEEIFEFLSKSSVHYNRDYYQLNDMDKYLILSSLFQKQKIGLNLNLEVVKEKIKQYLIYLCLQPEWEARFEPGLQYSINNLGSYLFQEKLFRFLNYDLTFPKDYFGACFHDQISNQYIDPKYIIQKIKSGTYLNYCLDFWLNNKYIKFDQNFLLDFKPNLLHQLLHRIMYNGIEWFYSMVNEFQFKGQQYNIYKNLFVCYEANLSYWLSMNDSFIVTLIFILTFLGLNINKSNIYYIADKYKNYNFHISYCYYDVLNKMKRVDLIAVSIIKIVNSIFKPLLMIVKSSLYKKDLINRLRANNINVSKATYSINKVVLEYYKYYFLFSSLRTIKDIYQKIDFMIYSWIKKRNKHIYLPKLIVRRNKKYCIKSLSKFKASIINSICIEKLNRK